MQPTYTRKVILHTTHFLYFLVRCTVQQMSIKSSNLHSNKRQVLEIGESINKEVLCLFRENIRSVKKKGDTHDIFKTILVLGFLRKNLKNCIYVALKCVVVELSTSNGLEMTACLASPCQGIQRSIGNFPFRIK